MIISLMFSIIGWLSALLGLAILGIGLYRYRQTDQAIPRIKSAFILNDDL